MQTAAGPGHGVRAVLPAWFWGLLVLLPCVAFSFLAAGHQQARNESLREAALAKVDAQARTALVESLQTYQMLLRSVQTVFLASNEVTAAEFVDSYRNLRLRGELPQLQALAYAHRETRADGDHYVTTMYAPTRGNSGLDGLDVVSQPWNLAALRMSRDTDEVAMSVPFRLVQDAADADAADGITLRLPVFTPGPPPRSMAERRARVTGSLAVSFRVRDMIVGTLPRGVTERLHLVFEDVTDGRARLLYDTGQTEADADGPHPRFVNEIRYGGRVWRVSTEPLRASGSGSAWQQSTLWAWLLASVLLALLVWSVAGTRRRALQMGMHMSLRYRESEQRFRTLNDLLPALVLMADPEDGHVLYANEIARARLGEDLDTAVLASLFEDASLRRLLRAPRDKLHPSNVEAALVSLNGDRFWASISMATVTVGDVDRLLMVASDISEQRQLTELLGYQATHDALTELYNRREFERNVQDALRLAARGALPCALLYIDLDQFKLINDTSGHIAGDQLLSQLALAMADQLRTGDILARLGGDEFGVLAANTGAADALALAERIRTRIEGHIYVWEDRSYTISASVGVVMLDRPGLTLGEALSHADSACYIAKDHGRNRVHLYSEQDDEAIRRRGEMEWANRLRTVLEEGRLLLDYQELRPLQSQADADPHIELLLRLRDEDGRVVPPGAFLPAAERYGMVSQLDRWVISEAIAHFDALHASGRAPGRCALNLSAATLEDEGLAEYVLDLIALHGVEPSRLCFEITETVAVRDLARAVRFIERLRTVGCQVALDDFGAGMSSFGYLKNLPVDVIKIDGSFIRDLDSDPMSRSIVDAITEIGHQRGLDVVAEWVSSDGLVDTLRALGVDYGQGFALHRPERVLYQREPE